MSDSISYRFGKAVGKFPTWLRLALPALIVVAVVKACSTTEMQNDAEMHAAYSASAARQIKANAEAKAKQDCLASATATQAEYAALMTDKKFSDAASLIRPCSKVLADEKLTKLVRNAEIAGYMTSINNTKLSARERSQAMYSLARDYPDLGAKYVEEAHKLSAQADRQDEATERKRKRSQGVVIGMTRDDVLASSWGKPQRVNTTINARGTREQWVYGGRNYLYFENGVLTTIQN